MSTTTQSATSPEPQTSPATTSVSAESIALSILNPTIPQSQTAATPRMAEQAGRQPATVEPSSSDGAGTTVVVAESDSMMDNDGEADNSSVSGSNSESSTSTETPGTISTPRSAHPQDSAQTELEPAVVHLDEPTTANTTDSVPPTNLANESEPSQEQVDSTSTEPQQHQEPPQAQSPVPENIPEWVKYEEDTSTPDAVELQEIESTSVEIDATNTTAIEKEVFSDLNDPEYRPYKKLRLSWIIKGVRGNRERPNRARVMASPAVLVDGKYWNIKFFPRGNKNRHSVAVFVRCSDTPPLPYDENLEGSFKCYEASPDLDLSTVEPSLDMTLTPVQAEEKEQSTGTDQPAAGNNPPPAETVSEEGDTIDSILQELRREEANIRRRRRASEDDGDDDSSISSDDEEPSPRVKYPTEDHDFRVSAQLGVVVYNPKEPRTSYCSPASHQFCPKQDDWGWDSAVSDWLDIHKRQRGQRQALLRDDTLAVDVYVRIYEDPTKALFWHPSPGETQWDSKTLTGLFPMGTKQLYHSPAVAGITALTLIVPFRQLIQSLDAGAWRRNSALRPRPLIGFLQCMLFQMRYMRRDELFIHLDDVIHEITKTGEQFEDVKSFWDVFRRALEIELQGDEAAIASLHGIFGDFWQSIPRLPVVDVESIQQSVDRAFSKAAYNGALPNFLPLMLDRQHFDSTKREWCLRYNRVRLLDEIDMAKYCTESNTKYTLYGFVCHDGERSSGKFFSVLRPAGPGTKWLAFSDGNGNKIFSHTRKELEEYEGLNEYELKKFSGTRQTAYMAIYIRSNLINAYLTDKFEPYKLPYWLKDFCTGSRYENPDNYASDHIVDEDEKRDKIFTIELYCDQSVVGHRGKVDMHTMKTAAKAREGKYMQRIKAHGSTTVASFRAKIAAALEVPEQSFKLWAINYQKLGAASKGYMLVNPDTHTIAQCGTKTHMCSLWLTAAMDTQIGNNLSKNFSKLAAACKDEFKPPVDQHTLDFMALDFDAAIDNVVNSANTEPPTETAQVDGDATANVDTAENPSAEQAATTEPQATTSTAPGEPTSNDQQVTTEVAEISPMVDHAAAAAAAPDEVQESIQAAVQDTVQRFDTGSVAAPVEVEHVSVSNALQESTAPLTTANHEPSDVNNAASTIDAAVSETPVLPTVPAALPIDNEASTPTAELEQDLPSGVTSETIAANTDNDGPSLTIPAPTVIPLNENQVIVIQSSLNLTGDLSAEDAALISSMIAADLQEAEARQNRTQQAVVEEPSADRPDQTQARADSDSSSSSRPVIQDIYGFIQHFSAAEQTLTTIGTFTVDRTTTLSSLIHSHPSTSGMYPSDGSKQFTLYKRDGTFRTSSTSPESSFADANMHHCCEVIIGDTLSESDISQLKAEAKFTDPGAMMKHQALVARRHPILSRTSSSPVEICDFGGDHYQGPLLNGQRHGASCTLVTASGDSYSGALVAGQKSGPGGSLTYANGDKYTGSFLDDLKHGQGEFIEARTGNRYVGGYENDKRWGKGVTYWEQADQQASLCQVCYFEEIDALFYRCGHVVACHSCARMCKDCPVCRKPVECVVKMYRS